MPALESSLTGIEIAQLPQDVTVELAGLSQGAHDQVVEALSVAHDNGTLSDVDVDHLIVDAQIADSARGNVEALHQEQADAVAAGDYAHAGDLAQATEFQLHEVQDHGGDAGAQLVTSESDQVHLDWARYHDNIAQAASQDAAHQAATGDYIGAGRSEDVATNHDSIAAHDANAADQGGHYGNHAYDTASGASHEASDGSVVNE